MSKTFLQGVKNRCRCGAVATGIKEGKVTAGGKESNVRIVASNCKACGLHYVADDYKDELTPEYQDTIHSVSKTNDV